MSSKNKTETGAENVAWDLSDLYKSPEDPKLLEDKKNLLEEADEFADKYHGRISALSASEFSDALRAYESLIQRAGKIGSYSHLIWSTNTEDPKLGKLLQEANELGSELSQKLVFFDVEWMKVDDERAEELINSKELFPWKHYLRVSRMYKDHTLTEDAEQVMSAKSVTGRSAWNRYFDETLGAARFELDGEEMTEQQVLSKLHSPDRDLRKRAHESLTETFTELSRSLTFIFNTLLADKHTNDKLRGYESWISSRNLSNQTDSETVDALITAVTGRYELVQRYYKLKKNLLGVDEMFDYDRYAPIAKNRETIKWDRAKSMVLEAYGDFHPRMKSIATEFFDKKWIDAAIRPGKRGGAYSASTVTNVHPYVFMNFDGQLRDVQTLAHELGHGVHQYLSRKQGELQSSTPLTTAETASVFGEMLVFNKLMENIEDPKEKLALLVSKIDDTIATVFRQISMNRFEDRIHTARREEGELTTEDFSKHWVETQNDLYGDSVTITDEYKLWWCYIPHFLHTPGYVYAYAFGELLVLALYDAYKNQKNGFSDRYIELLEAGGSDWPHNIVGKMDIDIRDAGFWNRGLDLFESMIDQAEELAESL
ncbi:M3 family oligoendopeptidase [Rhodohalobacter sp.]|uniref:M3 family oligoendopeptidase n=1 Tax=Rhodohalobacter sp. TaxID=1974210 RepID=UPI002ACD7CA0|nr:M3 family oligoendopeptidase [Rhodohalobacter sp.]MDZ7758019.1 M3 family oligoendopeptidase [Rhodohalobacter sp.]